MRGSWRSIGWGALALVGWFSAGPLGAGEGTAREGLTAAERRELLLPLYQQVKATASLASLEPKLGADGKFAPADVAAYVKTLPISPRELLQIDMYARRYEHMVPRYIDEWHTEWIRAHEKEARALYGDAQVDARLTKPLGEFVVVPFGAGLFVLSNANVAAGGAPAPEDYQGETQVAVNPNDTDQIVAAANTWDDISGTCGGGIQAVFYSSDGGATWGYTCAPGASDYPSLPACASTVYGSDPALFWNDTNEVFLNYMLLCGTTKFAMVVAKSTDGGATWNGQGVVANSWSTSDVEDKNFYLIDNSSTSAYYGRHYTCWDRNNNEKVAYSTDEGATWTEVDLPTPSGGGLDLGCDLAVQKNGRLHVVWNTLTCGFVSCTNERMFYSTSADGGVTWSAATLVKDFELTGFSSGSCPDAQDERCISPMGAVDVDRSGGECNGTVFVTYPDYPSGGDVEDTDIWMTTTEDLGVSWSTPVRVNDGGVTNRVQMHPFVAVDQYDGEVAVVWYDARNDANNKDVDVYLAVSRDCGATFGTNVQVTGASAEFNNSTISYSNENSTDNSRSNPNQYGEYLGLDIQDSTIYTTWTDTRHYFPASVFESEKENLGFASYPMPKLGYIKTFKSQAGDDGYVLELNETSSTGGSNNSTLTTTSAIRAGDSSTDQQYRGILSFGTLDLPDAVTIAYAKLRIRRGTVIGTSPFTTHGNLTVDVNTAGLNGDTALENADWEAAATASAVCTMSVAAANGDWSECNFNAAGVAAVNRGGKTQVRIRFTTGDNDDTSSDYVGFYSGDNADSASRPELVIAYY